MKRVLYVMDPIATLNPEKDTTLALMREAHERGAENLVCGVNDLWTEVTRTAAPGARVIFRTAAEPTLLPGRVDDTLLDQWDYRDAESLDFTRRDRSAIYGGFHLYVKQG